MRFRNLVRERIIRVARHSRCLSGEANRGLLVRKIILCGGVRVHHSAPMRRAKRTRSYSISCLVY